MSLPLWVRRRRYSRPFVLDDQLSSFTQQLSAHGTALWELNFLSPLIFQKMSFLASDPIVK